MSLTVIYARLTLFFVLPVLFLNRPEKRLLTTFSSFSSVAIAYFSF
jgi:hypothetical protein